jgi:3-phytase
MQKLFIATILTGSTLITGCSSVTSNEGSSTVALQSLPFSGEHSLALNGNQWLVPDAEQGIQLISHSNVISTLATPAEFIDQRQDLQGDRYLSLDIKNNRLISYRIAQGEFSDVRYSQTLPYPVEGMCLYQPGATELNLFVMDEQQTAHQLLLTDEQNGSLRHREIRQFPLPPNSEYCIVDDASAQLFVSEENIGVWRYNARAESEVARSIVDLIAPYGNLQKNSGPLALANGHLLIAEAGSHWLHSYDLYGADDLNYKSWELPAQIASDSLTASANADNVTVSLLDDDSGILFSAELALPKTPVTHQTIVQVPAIGETTPVADRGDAADDPAIWVNTHAPADSLILGTNKKRGLYVYDLLGEEKQELLVGRVNNVDVRQGFTFKGKKADIAAASQRDRHAISLFHINPDNGTVSAVNEIETSLDDVYGLCMYRSPSAQIYVFINDKDGRFEQYQITDSASGWSGRKVREFAVRTQPEGCAADDQMQRLFIGEEDVAVWTLGAEADDSTELVQVAAVSGILVDDIEGMDVYRRDGKAFLLVSSQGNDSYVLFNAEAPYEYIDRFRVGLNAGAGIDGASETDGLTVSPQALGETFPEGILVVQDGRNLLPDSTQNFKLVDWRSIRTINDQL